MHVITKVVLGALGLTGAYEGFRWWKARNAELAMMQGHRYALVLNYTKDPIAPVTQQQLQAQLDAVHPGMFNVISAAITSGPTSAIRQIGASVELVQSSQNVPVSTFTNGWPVDLGTLTLANTADLGPASQSG